MGEKNDLRFRLLGEAMRMLAENPAELTLRGVARAVGVSAMAPYRHFADKAALLGALKREGFERLHAVLLDADRAPDPREALVAQGMAYIDFALAQPALFRLMFGTESETASVRPPSGDTAYGVMAARVEGMVPDTEARTAITAAWAIVHGLATLTLDARLPRQRQHRRQVLELFADRLVASGATADRAGDGP